MKWFPGDVATLHMEFNIGTTPTDPTTVTLLVQDPEGDLTTYAYPAPFTATKVSTGIYEVDVPLPDEGQWLWRWVGTGLVPAADEGSIFVRRSEFVET